MSQKLDQETLQQELKRRKICRFCLCETVPKLTNIYMRDTRIKSSAPLPIQIMAIASIEVFSNDGMPSFVCSDCTAIFEFSYQFKQVCKQADTLLRQFPLTGQWPKPLHLPVLIRPMQQKPTIINKLSTQTTQIRVQQTAGGRRVPNQQNQDSPAQIKKILNTTPVPEPEPPQPIRPKIEISSEDDDVTTISLLDKLENTDEISMDDIQQLMESEEVEEDVGEIITPDIKTEMPIVILDTGLKSKPKLLNKSSVRILNKEAGRDNEPRLSLPKIKQDSDGNMEIVAEILDANQPYEDESDPKNAEVIDTQVYPCPHCDRSFPLLQLRDLHMKNHTRDRKFDCEECDKSFFSKYDLQRHVFTHNGERPFKCSACDKSFSRSTLLQRHEKSHTEIPKFICVTCERPFLSKEDMEKHAERHKINRPFQCKLCNKGFAFKQGLERHEVVHSRQQPYPCQYCNQSFSTPSKLARHLTAHAGQRPYPCKYCNKSYLLSHHLTRHLRSHKEHVDKTNTPSFMCSRCSASFQTRDELITHSATHADANNLSCPLCKEVFGNLEELNAHIGEHSVGEAYACEFCDLIFTVADKLQQHIDTEHAQEMEAYHEDDRIQANRRMKQSDGIDETLQESVNEILLDESIESAGGNNNEQIVIKKEKDSPSIIHQVIIKSAAPPGQDVVEEQEDNNENSLLIPLKQRKIQIESNKMKVQIESNKVITSAAIPNSNQQQLRRKLPTTPQSRDKNQPSIADSLMKMPKGITVKKTPAPSVENKTNAAKQSPNTTKSPRSGNNSLNVSPSTSSSSGGATTNVRIQRMRVTKAQAEQLVREGRIKMKDGQMILNKEK
ncbi:pita [Musca autumnalis]|uniref:pita n=1 Tax=Musca autumnalis TaxID=221902 RepID=UPI003CEFA756